MTEPAFVGRLQGALHSHLPDAAVTHEQVRRDRHRFIVVSEEFGNMDHPERQQLVWKITEEVVAKPDIWSVAMLITMAPAEVDTPSEAT